jgi:hypothetical protein
VTGLLVIDVQEGDSCAALHLAISTWLLEQMHNREVPNTHQDLRLPNWHVGLSLTAYLRGHLLALPLKWLQSETVARYSLMTSRLQLRTREATQLLSIWARSAQPHSFTSAPARDHLKTGS